MQIDLERYRRFRRSLRLEGLFLVAVATLGVCICIIPLLVGLSELISPAYDKDRVEGAVVLGVSAVPFAFSAFVLWSGIAKRKLSHNFDRLIVMVSTQPNRPSDEIAGRLSVSSARLGALLKAGVEGNFVFYPANPIISIFDRAGAPEEFLREATRKPGGTSLMIALASYGYGALAAVLLLTNAGKTLGQTTVGLVCVVGIPLTFVLDTVSVVGGILGIREVWRTNSGGSVARPVAALLLGLVGFVGVLLLMIGTIAVLQYGGR